MTDKPLFLSFQENLSDFVPLTFELMNGYVHRLFLSCVPEGLEIIFSEEISHVLSGNVLVIDLENRDGLGSFIMTFKAIGYPEQHYRISLLEKVTPDDFFGLFRSSEKKSDVLSLSENRKIRLSYSAFLSKLELFFDFLSYFPLTGEVEVNPVLKDDKKFFLRLVYEFRKDTFLVTLIREEYSDDDSYSRVLIGKNGPVSFLRDKANGNASETKESH